MKKADDSHPNAKLNMVAYQLLVKRHIELVVDFYDHQQTNQASYQKGYQQQNIPKFSMDRLIYQPHPRKHKRQGVE